METQDNLFIHNLFTSKVFAGLIALAFFATIVGVFVYVFTRDSGSEFEASGALKGTKVLGDSIGPTDLKPGEQSKPAPEQKQSNHEKAEDKKTSPKPSTSPTPTPTPTASPTPSPTPSESPTPTPTASPSPEPTEQIPSPSPSPTANAEQ